MISRVIFFYIYMRADFYVLFYFLKLGNNLKYSF